MSAGFIYAQPRLQARHGARPEPHSWRELAASASLAHFLETARQSSLRAWVSSLHPRQGARELERALKEVATQHTREVSGWLPAAWQPALRFCATRPLELVSALTTPEWQELWPSVRGAARTNLCTLVDLLSTHVQTLSDAPDDADSFLERRRLERRVTRLFRQHTEQPASVFSHLVLSELDLLRLRAGLLRRAELPDVRSERAWV